MDQLVGLLIGYLFCKLMGAAESVLPDWFHVTSKGPGKMRGPVVLTKHGPVRRAPVIHPLGIPEGERPVLTSTAAPHGVVQPSGLPPWPSGWKQATANHAMIERAWALLSVLEPKQRKVELAPGDSSRWLSYYASKSPTTGKKGVSIYEPRQTSATRAA